MSVLKVKKKIVLPAILAGSIVAGTISFTPQPSLAVGFMENSFNRITTNAAFDPNVIKLFSVLEAICYWIPPTAMVGCGLGLFLTRESGNDGAFAIAKSATLTLGVLIAILYIYDVNFVPAGGGDGIGASLPKSSFEKIASAPQYDFWTNRLAILTLDYSA